mmetsp:Transcript_13940/g.37680  ORF Transcript_13940/g.37680 Transcript_13940/m.37680 type:complete len:170 (+) Transcript_13940:3-512(+)
MNKSMELSETSASLRQAAAEEREALMQKHRAERDAAAQAHASQIEQLQQDMQAAADEAQERYLALQEDHRALQERWETRGPRDEDVELIQQLQQKNGELTELMRTSEERMAKLRAEMLLREENYNNHFKNGGAGTKMLNANAAMNAQSGVMDWMLKKRDSAGRKGSGRT